MREILGRIKYSFFATAVVVVSLSSCAAAATLPSGDLAMIQVKMTGTEMVVIENVSRDGQPVLLSDYVLEYFNKAAPANLAVPTDLQQLPNNITLPAGEALLLMGGSVSTCGASVVDDLSFSLADSGGYLQLARTAQGADGTISYSVQDHVSWTSSASGADLASVPSTAKDPNAVWYRSLDDGSWATADITDCSPVVQRITPSNTPTYVQWTKDTTFPPATIVSIASDENGDTPTLPASDVGLRPAIINELLPNPASPQTDANDEFIELYNPNSVTFDLSGFKLQTASTGSSTKHTFTFPGGTKLPAKSFVAFYADQTSVSLSNSGGKVWLLDPYGTTISQSDTYDTAKDGTAWALANGKWYWSSTTTPNAANIITATPSSSNKSSVSSKSTGHVQGASTTTGSQGGGSADSSNVSEATPIHPLVLALIVALALVYGVYEYRQDVANRLHQLRKYREARRENRQKT